MSKRNFIPAKESDRDLILKIQRKVASSPFMQKYRFNLIPETFDINTIAIAFMDGIHNIFAKPDIDEISIGDVINIRKSNRYIEDSEKSGNINCVITLGQVGWEIYEHGIDGWKDALVDDVDMRTTMHAASVLALKFLEDYNIGIVEPDDIYRIAVTFFVYSILTVDECSKNENIDSYNFRLIIGSAGLEYIRMGFAIKDGKRVLTLNPGPSLKLTVKSDDLTEGE